MLVSVRRQCVHVFVCVRPARAMASVHGVCVRVCGGGTVLGGTHLYRVGNVCLRVASIERRVHEWMCVSLGRMKLGACVNWKEYSVCGPGYTEFLRESVGGRVCVPVPGVQCVTVRGRCTEPPGCVLGVCESVGSGRPLTGAAPEGEVSALCDSPACLARAPSASGRGRREPLQPSCLRPRGPLVPSGPLGPGPAAQGGGRGPPGPACCLGG